MDTTPLGLLAVFALIATTFSFLILLLVHASEKAERIRREAGLLDHAYASELGRRPRVTGTAPHMSQNHKREGWATVYRKSIEATLPAPCVDCPGIVQPGDPWDVGHIVGIFQGGGHDRSNLGPSHRRCNRSEGGKIGARLVNQRRT